MRLSYRRLGIRDMFPNHTFSDIARESDQREVENLITSILLQGGNFLISIKI
jgi:hypothetical protein